MESKFYSFLLSFIKMLKKIVKENADIGTLPEAVHHESLSDIISTTVCNLNR
jgi:hypothetical protein